MVPGSDARGSYRFRQRPAGRCLNGQFSFSTPAHTVAQTEAGQFPFRGRHYLARGGLHCVCVFDAPDAEAIRSAFRTAEAAAPKGIWAATIHPGADDDVTQAPVLCNPAHTFAIVERTFAGPVSYAEVKAAEEVGTHSSNQREVRFLRSYFSSSRKRMICVYEAPDVEAVRAVNHHAGLPFERAWGAEVVVD